VLILQSAIPLSTEHDEQATWASHVDGVWGRLLPITVNEALTQQGHKGVFEFL
jgi:hypothetical protein